MDVGSVKQRRVNVTFYTSQKDPVSDLLFLNNSEHNKQRNSQSGQYQGGRVQNMILYNRVYEQLVLTQFLTIPNI